MVLKRRRVRRRFKMISHERLRWLFLESFCVDIENTDNVVGQVD